MTVEIIRRPNRLKAKVCGSERVSGTAIAAELLEQAAQVVADFSEKYPDQADIDLSSLLGASAAVLANPKHCADVIQVLRLEAREIMGQAETFGFALLTRFARSLYDLTDGWTSVTAQQSELIQVHTYAMTLIVRTRMKGDGGEIGRQLNNTLDQARRKFASSGDH